MFDKHIAAFYNTTFTSTLSGAAISYQTFSIPITKFNSLMFLTVIICLPE
jgi:hypothetical protein